jgi:hypothetical protein
VWGNKRRMLENTMNKPIPPAFMKGLFVALIAVLFLPSAVTADQWSVHYELNTDHYHPGDNGTLTLSYEGDMDVSVYFLSMNIVGVGIYEVTPAPPYAYKTGGKPLVVDLPFSIPFDVKPGYYQYSYEFDRGGGHPVQRGSSTLSIGAAGEPGPEQAGQNRNDSLPFPIIILVLLIIIVVGYLVKRRNARRNEAGKPIETGMLEQKGAAGSAASRFSPKWRWVKSGVGLAILLVWFVILPASTGMNPLFFVLIMFMPPFCIAVLPVFLMAIYLIVSRKIRKLDFFFMFIVVVVAVLLILATPGLGSGQQTQDQEGGAGSGTCGGAGNVAGAVCPAKEIRLQVSNREIGPPVLEYSSKSGIYPVVEIRDDSRFAIGITLIAPDGHVVHEETFDVWQGGQGNVDFNANRNLSVGNYTVEFRKGGELLASIPITIRY